jgi:hypothetical protein
VRSPLVVCLDTADRPPQGWPCFLSGWPEICEHPNDIRSKHDPKDSNKVPSNEHVWFADHYEESQLITVPSNASLRVLLMLGGPCTVGPGSAPVAVVDTGVARANAEDQFMLLEAQRFVENLAGDMCSAGAISKLPFYVTIPDFVAKATHTDLRSCISHTCSFRWESFPGT